jgi:hypothetical protein
MPAAWPPALHLAQHVGSHQLDQVLGTIGRARRARAAAAHSDTPAAHCPPWYPSLYPKLYPRLTSDKGPLKAELWRPRQCYLDTFLAPSTGATLSQASPGSSAFIHSSIATRGRST